MCRYLTCTKPFGANAWLDFYNVWDLTKRLHPTVLVHIKYLNMAILAIATYIKFYKVTDRTFDPFLLRQGEPGTSQYINV